MEVLAAIGGGLFVLASLVVGGRILWRARETRGLPELALGGGLFLMGGIGYPLTMIAMFAPLADGTRITLMWLHVATTVVGMGGVAWFTKHVFRPDDKWATALVAVLMVGFCTLAAAQQMGAGFLAYLDAPEQHLWYRQTYVGIVVMGWAGVEPLLYWLKQRRQLALGLADPVVADRFKLWSASILCATSISVLSAVLGWLGIAVTGTAVASLLVGTLGLVTAVLLALAFMPPTRYVDWVQARAAA